MSATTRWKDSIATDLTEVLDKMVSKISDDEKASTYRINYKNRKLSEDNKTIVINGSNVQYNVVRYGYTKITLKPNPEDNRETIKQGFIVVVSYAGAIYYIVDQKSDAKKLLRKYMGYTGKNEIEKADLGVVGDFFIWLVCRFYNNCAGIQNSFSKEKRILDLKDIKGIKGDTKDYQTTVTTSGESVMDTMSTLTFLSESKEVNNIIVIVSYDIHSEIRIKLTRDTVEIERPYVGEFEEPTFEELLGKLYVLLYFEILPLFKSEYEKNRKSDDWNKKAYDKFIRSIKEKIIEKMKNGLGD